MLFELVGLIEYYHPRMQLRLQLARIMILNLLNLYSLIWALFGKISGMLDRMGIILGVLGNKTTTEIPKSVQTTTFSPLITKIMSTTSATITTITDTILTTINETVTQSIHSTTEFSHNDSSEDYNYQNPDYFEQENSSTTLGYSTTTPSSFNDTDLYYDDNFTTNLTSNLTKIANLIANLSTTQLYPDDVAYYDEGNDTLLDYENKLIQNNLVEHDAPDFRLNLNQANETVQLELRKLCWETMFGQGNG